MEQLLPMSMDGGTGVPARHSRRVNDMAQRRNGIEIHWRTVTRVAIKNDISAPTTGEGFYAIWPIVAQVIDNSIGAKLFDELELMLAAHQTNDLHLQTGDLNDQRADGAAAEWTTTHWFALTRAALCTNNQAV